LKRRLSGLRAQVLDAPPRVRVSLALDRDIGEKKEIDDEEKKEGRLGREGPAKTPLLVG